MLLVQFLKDLFFAGKYCFMTFSSMNFSRVPHTFLGTLVCCRYREYFTFTFHQYKIFFVEYRCRYPSSVYFIYSVRLGHVEYLKKITHKNILRNIEIKNSFSSFRAEMNALRIWNQYTGRQFIVHCQVLLPRTLVYSKVLLPSWRLSAAIQH